MKIVERSTNIVTKILGAAEAARDPVGVLLTQREFGQLIADSEDRTPRKITLKRWVFKDLPGLYVEEKRDR